MYCIPMSSPKLFVRVSKRPKEIKIQLRRHPWVQIPSLAFCTNMNLISLLNDNMQKHGTLIVRSKPSHAIVIVNDKQNITPVFFNLENRDLPYDIMIKKEGYIDHIQNVVIQNGEKIEINAILKKRNRRKHN
jgi:nitrous oxide reductase